MGIVFVIFEVEEFFTEKGLCSRIKKRARRNRLDKAPSRAYLCFTALLSKTLF
jgi:hypothetical protein